MKKDLDCLILKIVAMSTNCDLREILFNFPYRNCFSYNTKKNDKKFDFFMHKFKTMFLIEYPQKCQF